MLLVSYHIQRCTCSFCLRAQTFRHAANAGWSMPVRAPNVVVPCFHGEGFKDEAGHGIVAGHGMLCARSQLDQVRHQNMKGS